MTDEHAQSKKCEVAGDVDDMLAAAQEKLNIELYRVGQALDICKKLGQAIHEAEEASATELASAIQRLVALQEELKSALTWEG